MMDEIVQSVFISYARQDALEFATRLAADLRDAGHKIFLDLTNIEKGGLWEVRLEQGIRDSNILAAVMTVGSIRENSVCRDEVVFALNEGKSIIPLRLDPSPNLKPTLLLARRNWIDFSIDYSNGLQSLLSHLEGDLTALRSPTLPTVAGLVPLDFGPEIARLTSGFIGREWLNRELEGWLNISQGRAFVIIGEPGIGKSAIAAWLSVIRQDQTVSVHFCTDRNSRTLQPLEFVASLVAQLSTQVNGFAQTLASRQPEVRRPSANDAFRELVIEPAQKLSSPGTPLIVVVDSLDEAIRKEGETLLDVLVNQANDLPAWLRIVATTRPDEQVLQRIRRLHTFELRPDVVENMSDVTQYCNKRLSDLNITGQMSDEDTRVVLDQLPSLANGNFLYARMVLDALEEGILSVQSLRSLSPGLSDFYAKTLSILFPKMETFEIEAQPILRALSVAMEPVPFTIIDRATRLRDEGIEETHRRLLRLRSCLRVTGKGFDQTKFALFHKSLGDWLTDLDAAGLYWCFPEKGKEQLAEACWQDYQNDPEEMSEYALRYAMYHLRDVRRNAEARILSQDEMIRQRRNQLGISAFFLSYAPGDDDPFVSKLYRDLISRGFDIWFDQERLSSKNFSLLTEVNQVLDEYDRLVLIIGPNALKSDYVKAEWRYALTTDKAIIPILRLGQYQQLPEELSNLYTIDARDDALYPIALNEFIRVVTTPPAPLGRLFFVPPLPAEFVARPLIIQKLKEAVLSDLSTPIAVSARIVGLAGIGKTVLLTSFARDQEVRRAFPDGIFWLTLGQQPNIVGLQRMLLSALGVSSDVDTIEIGYAMLQRFLADAQALIILDDARDVMSIIALSGLGKNCRTLITTRNIRLADKLGSKVLSIDGLSKEESLSLLAQSAGFSVDALPKDASELVSHLGFHPLALKIFGARARESDKSWAELRDNMRAESPANSRSTNLKDILEASYKALSKQERKLLIELSSAFSEEPALTTADVAKLWMKSSDVAEQDVRETLAKLYSQSWVKLNEDHPGGTRVSLHPLISQFLRAVSEKPDG